MEEKKPQISRRNFIGTMAVASSILIACAKPKRELVLPPLLETAPDGRELKAGLIGCGGRGTGAAINFLKAGPKLKLVAMGDVFADRIAGSKTRIIEEMAKVGNRDGFAVEDKNTFIGFDSYQKVIDAGVDLVILAEPPHFRHISFAAAVEAKKHVFMEKPIAVDPMGIKSILASAEKAEAFGLSVVTGTQRRHQKEYIETYKRVADGAIGDIVAARAYWNMQQLWYRNKEEGWSNMEWMIRDWVNWRWLSGDHIVEQHVHNLDVINWFTEMHPIKAVGMGGRQRRVTGDQYDFFSIDFEYANGMHMHSMCRQINGCVSNVSEFIVGTKGSSNCRDTIFKPDGTIAWKFEGQGKNPYDQEHVDLVTAIRTEKPYNEAKNTAISNLVAIMGRESAYTGKETTWEEMEQSTMKLGPAEYVMGDVPVEVVIPVPGTLERQQ